MNRPNQIDYVIFDFNMPDGTGLQLIQSIRPFQGKKTSFPLFDFSILILAAFACVQAGANDYMIKPWKDNQLMKKLSTYGL